MVTKRVLARGWAVATAVALVGGGVIGIAGPAAAVASSWCVDRLPGDTEPCLEDVTRDGVPVGSSDPTWRPYVGSVDPTTGLVMWGVEQLVGYLPASEAAHTWVVTVNTRSESVVTARVLATDATVARSTVGSDQLATITGRPVSVTQGCSQATVPWTCPTVPVSDETRFEGAISDERQWTDAAQRAGMYGSNFVTNIDATEWPRQVVGSSIQVTLANSHFHGDGVTPVVGFAHIRLPYAYLTAVTGLSDPASLAGAGLIVTLSGSGPGTISVVPSGDGALLIDVTGLTFSTRTLLIRKGSAAPTRPTKLRARRTAKHKGSLSFVRSRANGIGVSFYQAKCLRARGRVSVANTIWASRTKSPVVVRGLRSGKVYRCKVRAVATANGLTYRSAWSTAVTLPR